MKLAKLIRVLKATRLNFVAPLPLSAVALGSILAYRDIGEFHILVSILQFLTLASAYAATNLLNTYFDFINKIDGPDSEDRTLVDKILNPEDVLIGSGVAVFLSMAFLGLLVTFSPAPFIQTFHLFMVGILLGVLYTSGFGLKYIAMGDIMVFLACGVISVLFVFLSQGGSLLSCHTVAFYSLPLGLHATVILHVNNSRDRESDHAARIWTVAIFLGKRGSHFYFISLIFLPFLIFFVLVCTKSFSFILPMFSIWKTLKCERNYASGSFRALTPQVVVLYMQQTSLYILAWLLY